MHVVVVGAGLLGLSTAWHLAQAGHTVTVLERRAGSALEASFANASLLTPSLSAPWMSIARLGELLGAFLVPDAPIRVAPAALGSVLGWGLRALLSASPARFGHGLAANIELARFSLQQMAELRSDATPWDFDHAAQGTLMVFRGARAFAQAASNVRILEDHGLDVALLDAQGIVRAEPALGAASAQMAGGVLHREDEHGDPYRFCGELERRCRALGVQFAFDTTVLRFDSRAGAIAAVETDRLRYEADRYVLAAGSFSPALARPLGLPLPVQPVRGYSIDFDLAQDSGLPRVPVLDGESHCAVTPLGRRLRVTGFAELAGFDMRLRADRRAALERNARALFPALLAGCEAPDATQWCGLRPLSCDGVPLVGPTRIPNLFLNTGHGTLGWTMAMGSGRLLADLLCGRRPPIPAEPYTPLRFS